MELECVYNAAIVGLSDYMRESKDRLTRLVQEHQGREAIYSLQK